MIIGPAISSLIAIPQPLGIFKETSGFPFIFFYSQEGWGMSIKVVIRRIAIKVGIKGVRVKIPDRSEVTQTTFLRANEIRFTLILDYYPH